MIPCILINVTNSLLQLMIIPYETVKSKEEVDGLISLRFTVTGPSYSKGFLLCRGLAERLSFVLFHCHERSLNYLGDFSLIFQLGDSQSVGSYRVVGTNGSA